MPRIKEIRKCKRCGSPFHRHNGNVKAKYCSRLCACRDRNTKEHQTEAGKRGGFINGENKRGTGKNGYIKRNGIHEHRIVFEKKIGRKLKTDEIIHHKDLNKHNNNIKNLVLMTQSQHAKLHITKQQSN